ncbi:MAG: tryptophan--tRNA ligase, partial [Parcubacteria group bacterium]
TQFKDKSKQHKKDVNAGLFTYPCLMAADILLYDTNAVPVGEDQTQHVELTRTIAKKFNAKYGDTFILPEVIVNKTGKRIMSLDNPEQKMSKSAQSEYNYISMLDKPEVIRKKIMSAVTDSGSEIKYDAKKPAIGNLIDIYQLITGKTIKEIEKHFDGQGYGEFKKQLAGELVNFLSPIQEKFNAIDDNELDNILKTGAMKARLLAQKKIKEVKEKIGL